MLLMVAISLEREMVQLGSAHSGERSSVNNGSAIMVDIKERVRGESLRKRTRTMPFSMACPMSLLLPMFMA